MKWGLGRVTRNLLAGASAIGILVAGGSTAKATSVEQLEGCDAGHAGPDEGPAGRSRQGQSRVNVDYNGIDQDERITDEGDISAVELRRARLGVEGVRVPPWPIGNSGAKKVLCRLTVTSPYCLKNRTMTFAARFRGGMGIPAPKAGDQ